MTSDCGFGTLPLMSSKNNGKAKQIRGFAAMDPAKQLAICKLGGRKTYRRHGAKHMAKIGRAGRAKRAKLEAQAKAA